MHELKNFWKWISNGKLIIQYLLHGNLFAFTLALYYIDIEEEKLICAPWLRNIFGYLNDFCGQKISFLKIKTIFHNLGTEIIKIYCWKIYIHRYNTKQWFIIPSSNIKRLKKLSQKIYNKNNVITKITEYSFK